MSVRRSRLAELIIELGLAEGEEVDAALAESQEQRRRLPEVLAARGIVEEGRLAKAVASRLGLDLASLDPLRVHPRVLGRVPPEVARVHGVLPFAVKRSEDAEILYLAMSDPLDMAATTEVQRRTGCRVRVLMAPASALDAAIAESYAPLRSRPADPPVIIPGRPPPSHSSEEVMEMGDVTIVDQPREVLAVGDATVPSAPVLPPFLASEPEPFDLSKRPLTVLGTPLEEEGEEEDAATMADVIEAVAVEPPPTSSSRPGTTAPASSPPRRVSSPPPSPPPSRPNNHAHAEGLIPGEAPTEVPGPASAVVLPMLLPLEIPVVVVETSHPFEGPTQAEIPVGLGETAVIPHLDKRHELFEPPPPPETDSGSGPPPPGGAGDIPLSLAEVEARAAEGVLAPISNLAEIEEVQLEPLEDDAPEIVEIEDDVPVPSIPDVRAALAEVAAAREPTPIPTPVPDATAVWELDVDPEAERLVAALESGASLNAPDRARLVLALGRCLLERGLLPREALLRALSE